MPGYIKKKLKQYDHAFPNRAQTCPYLPEPKSYSAKAQAPLPKDNSKPLDKNGIRQIQPIVGSILYYARAVDMTVLMTLSSVASEQMTATEKTQKRCLQLQDYLASNSEAKVRYRASDMIMNIHSDASYLLELGAISPK